VTTEGETTEGQGARGPGATARAWVWVVGALAAWSLLTWATGGFFLEWRGLRVSSRDPIRPLLVAAVVVAWAFWRHGRSGVARDLDIIRVDIDFDRWAPPLALILSLATVAIGVTWTTRTAGGADSWSFVSQARLWADGNLIVEQPIVSQVPWPNADRSFTPLNYTQVKDRPAIVSIAAPGYPMLMAVFSPIHPDAIFWVVPLSGGLLVGMSFLLGRALGGSAVGLLTCALVATSPAVLFQLVAPMSDVVVAAFWIAALVVAIPNRRDTWLGAGTVSSLAILTRPNTAPIAAVFAIAAFWHWRDQGGAQTLRERLWKVVAYGTGTVPGVLSAAAINTALYGGPFQSGYGTAANLYSLQNLLPNTWRYFSWLLSSETPFVLLALAAPFVIRDRATRRLAAFSGLCACATWFCYVFYLVFNDWWYLRFVLTAFPCILALASLSFVWVARKIPPVARTPVVLMLLVPLVVWRIEYATDAGTFRSWKHERRYIDAGRLVNRRLEPNAILYSGQHSGSLRYYGHRLTVRWQSFDPTWFDRSIQILKDMGYKPYIVVEDGEREDFRQALGGSRYGQLDWPPLLEIENQPKVSVYDPDGAK
jgi:hypothetical protein